MWDKFIEATKHHFHFLETDFGFRLTSNKVPFAVFESDKLQVLVLFDESRGNELDLGIKRIKDSPRKDKSIGIENLMRLKDGPIAKGYPVRFPATEKALDVDVKSLADHLRKYGLALLQGNLRDLELLEQLEQEFVRKPQEHKNDAI